MNDRFIDALNLGLKRATDCDAFFEDIEEMLIDGTNELNKLEFKSNTIKLLFRLVDINYVLGGHFPKGDMYSRRLQLLVNDKPYDIMYIYQRPEAQFKLKSGDLEEYLETPSFECFKSFFFDVISSSKVGEILAPLVVRS